jgi:hypothetical protein
MQHPNEGRSEIAGDPLKAQWVACDPLALD